MEYYDAYHELNQKLDELADLCAKYINDNGYHAYPQKVATTQEFSIYRTIMPHKTVAVHAGLGWIGKSALFVTEGYGSAIRLTSVLTDAPIACCEPTIRSYCGDCMQCKQACPGQAISGHNWRPELDRDEFFDALACRKKARELSAEALDQQITLCGKCIEICPYTRRYLDN
jgi:epoxyqueuosine reductase